jgi:biopolymer transport protein ExbD
MIPVYGKILHCHLYKKLTIMATIETATTKTNKGKKLVKKSTWVDLTPMVDLGFLLITFFVFTTALSKPKVMGIVAPKEDSSFTPVCESCTITAFLTKDDKIFYYEGMQQPNTVLKQTSFDAAGLRKILLDKKAAVKNNKGTADAMVLIVKPANESSYKNFVDILDEVAINQVKHYFIDEINATDSVLLKSIR